VALMSHGGNDTLENWSDLEPNDFSWRGFFLALASSLPTSKVYGNPTFVDDIRSLVMPALLEGFRNNTSLHEVNIADCERGKCRRN
jgi:hypothetical protein